MADTPTKTLKDGTVVYRVSEGVYSRTPPEQRTQQPAAAPAEDVSASGRPMSQYNQKAPGDPTQNAARTGLDLVEGISDAAVGAGSAAAWGLDDEIVGSAVPGVSQEDYQARKNLANERSPAVSAMGGLVGDLATGKVLGAAAKGVKYAPVAARAAQRLANSDAAQGAIEGAASAAPGERLQGAATGTAAAFVPAKVLKTGGRMMSRFASGETARTTGKLADELRVEAGGQSVAEAADAPGGVKGQADALRRLGIGKEALTSRRAMRDQADQAVSEIEGKRAPMAQRMQSGQVSGQSLASRMREGQKRLPKKDASAQADFEFLEKQAKAYEPRIIPGAPPAPPAPTRPAAPAGATAPGGRARARQAPPAAPAAPAAPPAPPKATPVSEVARDAMPRRGDKIVDSPVSFDELEKGRKYWGPQANFGAETPAARRKQDMFQAYAESQRELGNQIEPGLGDQYRALGRDQMHAINSRDALGRGTQEALSYMPWSIASRVARDYVPNLKAHFTEGVSGAISFVSPNRANTPDLLQSGYEQSQQIGSAAGRMSARADTNDDQPGLQEAVDDYQRSALDPAYRLRRQSGVQ